jgi:hypothetical protein
VELVRGHRIVEAVTFETTDPALSGEITIIVTFERVRDGTEVTLPCKNLPRGCGGATTKRARACHWSWRTVSNEERGGAGPRPRS